MNVQCYLLGSQNIEALKEADANSGDSPALIKVQYTSKYRCPDQTTKPLTTPATDDDNTGAVHTSIIKFYIKLMSLDQQPKYGASHDGSYGCTDIWYGGGWPDN